MKRIIFSILVLILMAGCGNKNAAVIDGQFFGAADKLVTLERITPTGSIIADTSRTNSEGKFNFKIDFTDVENPSFFNVRLADEFVPLLVSAGEKVELSSVGKIYFNYKVSGSEGSEKLNDYHKLIVSAVSRLDSISNLYNLAVTQERRTELGRLLSREYVKMKQGAISFVMKNSNSLASIVPLFQPMYTGRFLFDAPGDVVYYRAVADSMQKYHPQTAFLKSLRNEISRVDNYYAIDSMLLASVAQNSNFPEIETKDAAGNGIKLSQTVAQSGAVLLTFTSNSTDALKALNREFLDVYNKYKVAGFEIFEVSVDTDRAGWLKNITDARLPWIRTNNFAGTKSGAVNSYNVQKIPANFLINTHGDIVGKDLTPEKLESALKEILK